MSAPDRLDAGLYVVATPIGAARDITLRALDILRLADMIAAEDTRVLRRLMEIHGIPVRDRMILPYHDHNGAAQRPRILAALSEGRSVAHVSDAGTPLVADPGFALTREAIRAGHRVVAAPGPSAVLAALVVSGLPSDRFLFAGFPPPKAVARQKTFEELAQVPATLIFYESPGRCLESLNTLVAVMGPDREAALCRELTKKFEETRRGTLAELAASAQTDPPRGEIVILVDRSRAEASPEDRDRLLAEALTRLKVKEAAAEVADRLGLGRREVYQAALRLRAGPKDDG